MDDTKAEAKQAARECFTRLWAAITTPFDSSGCWTLARCAATSTG
jgi:hypothetical protein